MKKPFVEKTEVSVTLCQFTVGVTEEVIGTIEVVSQTDICLYPFHAVHSEDGKEWSITCPSLFFGVACVVFPDDVGTTALVTYLQAAVLLHSCGIQHGIWPTTKDMVW